jgi:hypothetical protein
MYSTCMLHFGTEYIPGPGDSVRVGARQSVTNKFSEPNTAIVYRRSVPFLIPKMIFRFVPVAGLGYDRTRSGRSYREPMLTRYRSTCSAHFGTLSLGK